MNNLNRFLFPILLFNCFFIGCESPDSRPYNNNNNNNNGGSEEERQDDDLVGSYSGTITVSGQSPVLFVLEIESVSGKKVKGHNIAAGNRRSVSGFYEKNGTDYVLTLNESGDHQMDGSFVINLDKSNGSYSGNGTWTGYKNGTKAGIKLYSGAAVDVTPLWMNDLPLASSTLPIRYFNKDKGYPKAKNVKFKKSIAGLINQIPDSKYVKKGILSAIENDYLGGVRLLYLVNWGNFDGLILHYTESENEGGTILIFYDKSGNYQGLVVLESISWGGRSVSAFVHDDTIESVEWENQGRDMELSKVTYLRYTIDKSSGKVSVTTLKEHRSGKLDLYLQQYIDKLENL